MLKSIGHVWPGGLAPFDDLLQNPQPLRLHRAHADSRHEPHALVLGVAVDDLNAVVRRRVMERITVIEQDDPDTYPATLAAAGSEIT